jgi:hypothetical protein
MKFTLERTGAVDITFEGEHVAGSKNEDGTFCVDLYTTQGGQFVGWIRRTIRGKTGGPKSLAKAIVTPDPVALLSWLKEDARGVLGEISKQAWTSFCAALSDRPEVQACAQEQVD